MSRNAAPATKSQTPPSANIAPATQNESHHGSAWHMKRHLHCVEQVKSPSNCTEYCACRAKWIAWLIRVTYESSFTTCGATRVALQLDQILRLPRNSKFKISGRHPWIASANTNTIQQYPTTFRRHSDDIPTTSDGIRLHSDDFRQQNRHLAPAALDTLLVPSWRRFCIEKYNMSRSAYLPKCHEMLRLSRKVRLHLQQILHLPPKLTHVTDPHHIWSLYFLLASSLYASILSRHLFSLGIYSLYASILSTHLFSRHLFSLGIYFF